MAIVLAVPGCIFLAALWCWPALRCVLAGELPSLGFLVTVDEGADGKLAFAADLAPLLISERDLVKRRNSVVKFDLRGKSASIHSFIRVGAGWP
jgi:hypothetical protein